MDKALKTLQNCFDDLDMERKTAMQQLRKVLETNMPKGFEACINYGMYSFVVPHSLYPAGYHCDPKLPLGFISIASQKNYVVLHHMGLYANTTLLNWFVTAYEALTIGKLDMGKGCVRFKKMETIPYKLIGELCKKITAVEWITMYENAFKKK